MKDFFVGRLLMFCLGIGIALVSIFAPNYAAKIMIDAVKSGEKQNLW